MSIEYSAWLSRDSGCRQILDCVSIEYSAWLSRDSGCRGLLYVYGAGFSGDSFSRGFLCIIYINGASQRTLAVGDFCVYK